MRNSGKVINNSSITYGHQTYFWLWEYLSFFTHINQSDDIFSVHLQKTKNANSCVINVILLILKSNWQKIKHTLLLNLKGVWVLIYWTRNKDNTNDTYNNYNTGWYCFIWRCEFSFSAKKNMWTNKIPNVCYTLYFPEKMKCVRLFVDLKFPYRSPNFFFFYAFWLYWETRNRPFILDGFVEHITDLKNKIED